MENYKVRVANEAESKEAQELFLKYGATGNMCLDQSIRYVCTFNGALTQYDFLPSIEFKRITIPELRALVSLHKNPINMDEVLSEVRSDALGLLKDKPMKEYLNKLADGTYKLVVLGDVIDGHDGLIEIPEGAEVATTFRKYIIFWKDEKYSFSVSEENKWCYKSCDDSRYFSLGEYMNEYSDASVIWQRAQHPEELPFVDDEPLKVINSEYSKDGNSVTHTVSLNNQYAEIEQVRQASIADTLNERQSTYGSFEDVANTTQYLLQMLSTDAMSDVQLEALHMICSKLARIAHGDPNYKDNWHDIAGYATLVERSL